MKKSEALKKVAQIFEEYEKENKNFIDYKSESELKTILNVEKQDSNRDMEVVFSYIEKYLEYSVNTEHPQFLNRMWT
jgi:sulfinoalanine decarboxylase